MTKDFNVSVSMNQAAPVKTGVVLKQGDFGFDLKITVLDFTVTGTTPQIVFRKPMGSVESTDVTASGNVYTYTFKGTELDTPGKVFCDLKLKNSTTQRISTASFQFECIADTLDGLAEESSSYSDTIAQIIDGYEEEVENLSDKINLLAGDVFTAWTESKYVDLTSTSVDISQDVYSDSNYKYALLDCAPGQKLTITGDVSGSAILFAFLDASNNIILKATKPTGVIVMSADNVVLEAPADTSKFIFNTHKANNSELIIGIKNQSAYENGISRNSIVKNSIENLNQKHMVTVEETVNGFFHSQLGILNSSDDYRTTDYIFVGKGEKIVFSPKIRKFLAYKDINEPILSSFINDARQNFSYTATEDVYVRATVYVSDISSASLSYTIYEQNECTSGYVLLGSEPVSISVTADLTYVHKVITCTAGDVFTISGSASYTVGLYAFLDSSGNYTARANVSEDGYADKTVLVAPANSTKFVFNARTSSAYEFVSGHKTEYEFKNAAIRDRVLDNRVKYLMSNNLIDCDYLTDGFINDDSGRIKSSSTYKTTDYIFVEKGQTIIFEPRIRKLLAYHDINSPVFGSFVDNPNNNNPYSYVADNDVYLRISIYAADIGKVVARYGQKTVDNVIVDTTNLIDFSTLVNHKNCTFSVDGDEVTISTSTSTTWGAVRYDFANYEPDQLYMFTATVKEKSESACFRMLFLGETGDATSSYSGIRTDYPEVGKEYSVFAIPRPGCTAVKIYITGGTAAEASLVLKNIRVQKVVSVIKPEEKKKTTFSTPKARVSIIDDDGRKEFYTYLLPMIRTYNVPIATAYEGDRGFEYPDTHMTREQLQEVEAAGGEVIGHLSNGFIILGDKAEPTLIYSKRMMEANGFFTNIYVYAYGENNEPLREMTSKYYDCAFKTAYPYVPGYRTEMGCVPTFRLNRVHCGGEEYDLPTTEGIYANLDTASMDYFEQLIQECIENNSWLILYTHAWQMENGQQPTEAANQFELMEDIIERILELKEGGTDIDIIKVADGFEMFGNAFDAGDYLGQCNNDLTLHSKPGCAISKQGLYDFPTVNNITPQA